MCFSAARKRSKLCLGHGYDLNPDRHPLATANLSPFFLDRTFAASDEGRRLYLNRKRDQLADLGLPTHDVSHRIIFSSIDHESEQLKYSSCAEKKL